MIHLRKRVISAMMALVMVLTILTGCANNQKSETNSGEESIVVTDQIGREVKIEGEVKNIVSSYYLSSSLLIALGKKDNVVGIELKADTRGIYKKVAPEFLDLPGVGSGKGINVEQVAKLDPDVVIIPKKLKDSVEQFEQLNIPVVVIDPETLDNFIDFVELMGKVVGAEERSKALIEEYERIFEEVRELTKDVKDRPTVYLSSGSDFLRTCTSKMYQNELIDIAGGKNVSSDLQDGYWQAISAEQLVSWNPEKIFTVSYAEYANEDIVNDVRFKDIEAIKNGEIKTFPSKLLEPWDYPTPSSILGVLWLTSQLHPELYSEEDYVKEAKNFYKTYFNMDVTEEELGL